MTPAIAIWLAILIALGLLFIAVVRRVSVLVTRSHELEGYQRAVAEIDAAAGSIADPLIAELDAFVRGRSGDATHVAGELPHAAAALREVGARARQVQAPVGLAAETTSIVRELDRAARSAELAARGLGGLLASRSDRQGEWTVDIKRGSLNLRNARDTIRTVAAHVAAMTAAELIQRRDSPWAQAAIAPRLYVADGTDDEDLDTFESRM